MKTDTKVPTDDFFVAHEFQPTCTMCEIHPAIWIVKWHGCITTLRCDDCWKYEHNFVTSCNNLIGCGHCKKTFIPVQMVSVEPINPD